MTSSYDRITHQNKIARAGKNQPFALMPPTFDKRAAIEAGPNLLNDQRMSSLYHYLSSTKSLLSHVPFEEMLDIMLMHSDTQDGKTVNFEKVDSAIYPLFANYSDLLDKIEKDEIFKSEVLSDKDPELVIKDLFERLEIDPSQLKSQTKNKTKQVRESYGSLHDTNPFASYNTLNPALKGEELYNILEKNPLSKVYWKTFTNGFDVLDAQFSSYQQSIDSIAKNSKPATTIYDPFSDNKSKTVTVHQNAHGMISDREFENWSAKEMVAFLTMNRSGMKDLEQGLNDIFGKVSTITGPNASKIANNKPTNHVNDFFQKHDFSKTINPNDLQPIQSSLIYYHQFDNTFYDSSFNKNISADILTDFKDQGVRKYLYTYKKDMLEPLKAPRKLVSSKKASKEGVYVKPKTFEYLYDLGVITNKGDITTRYRTFDFSKDLIQGDPQENQEVIEALQQALYGDKKINLDLLDQSNRINLKLNTPQMGSLSLIDILENANSGSSPDELLKNATNSYTVLLDMVKSMTGIDSQTDASQDLPDIKFDKGVYSLNIYPDANWVSKIKSEENTTILSKVKNQPLQIKSKNKQELLDFYKQIREFVAYLEPLVVSFMDTDTQVTYYEKDKLIQGPLQVLNNNLGAWDHQSNSRITKESKAYKVWVDHPVTSRYFETPEMKKASKTFRDRLDEATFLKMFEKYVYGIQVKSEHNLDKKEDKEKKEKASEEYLEEVRDTDKKMAQERANVKKKENQNKKDENERISNERKKKIMDSLREKLRKKSQSKKAKGNG